MKFKVGDVVICIEGNIGASESLVTGREYTITEISDPTIVNNHVRVSGIPKTMWMSQRFILSQPYKNEQKLKKALGLK